MKLQCPRHPQRSERLTGPFALHYKEQGKAANFLCFGVVLWLSFAVLGLLQHVAKAAIVALTGC